jgi:hypothetical protein
MCAVCQRHTSIFCSVCGMDRPILAPMSRKGEPHRCLNTQLNDAIFRATSKKQRSS